METHLGGTGSGPKMSTVVSQQTAPPATSNTSTCGVNPTIGVRAAVLPNPVLPPLNELQFFDAVEDEPDSRTQDSEVR